MKKTALYLLDRALWVAVAWAVITFGPQLWSTPAQAQEPFLAYTETTPTVELTVDTTITVWQHEGWEPTTTVAPGGEVEQMTLAEFVSQQVDSAFSREADALRELQLRVDGAANDGYDVPWYLHEWADDSPERPIKYGQFRPVTELPRK